ncbi:MAG TPA: ABC transporter permease [Ktedonobacteraceae bacterium]|jgi:ABC-type dipeptide/oligopeptide/nickel transport system permease component
MIQFLVKRFIGLIFVLICVTFITFIMGYFAPGDPIRVLLGTHFNPVTYAQLRHQYGLDLPWYQQYFNFVNGLLHLSFGYSFNYQGEPVWNIISNSLGASAELGLWGLILTFIIGIPLGIIAALRMNTWVDTAIMGFALACWAIPIFVLAIYGQVIILTLHSSVGLIWPVSGWDGIQAKIVPILIFAFAGMASVSRYMRTSMLEVLQQDYIRTARAKGLLERAVIYRHALRNALIPIVTLFGVALGLVVTSLFFLEQIFNISGIGSTSISAINNRDYPVIQATVIIGAIAVVLGNLIADLLYSVIDPRIKTE